MIKNNKNARPINKKILTCSTKCFHASCRKQI